MQNTSEQNHLTTLGQQTRRSWAKTRKGDPTWQREMY